MKKLLLASALVFSGNVSVAMDGNEFFRGLTENADNWYSGRSAGYMDGTLTMLIYEKRICLPSGMKYGQIWDLLEAEFKANPQDRHKDAAFLIARTLMPLFPCGGNI